jgi:uncharacterized protein YkwD
MSDNSSAVHYHKKNVRVLGASRKIKYLKLMFVVLLAALAVIAYFAMTSGILSDENPAIPQHLLIRINSERLLHNLPPVQADSNLAQQAERKSQEIRISQMAYNSPSGLQSDHNTNGIVYPKISWAVANINLEPPLFDIWIAGDAGFQSDIVNKEYTKIGIGSSSDGYNYYIVTKWE